MAVENIPASAAFSSGCREELGGSWVGTAGTAGCKDCEKIVWNAFFSPRL